jgi:hypothetical protein
MKVGIEICAPGDALAMLSDSHKDLTLRSARRARLDRAK